MSGSCGCEIDVRGGVGWILLMLKHIEDDAIEKILELYAGTSKQVFIAMDKEGSYTEKAQKIMEASKVLQLSPGEGALFGRTWNDVEVEQ